MTGSDAPVTFVHNTLEDAAAQARFLLSSGMARMSLRQSDAGSYTALLDAGGQVALYRGGQVMGAAAVTPAAPGMWRVLRLSAIGDLVRVAVDGVEVIAARDPAPLPMGTLSFASVGQNALVVDDVAIWRSDNNLMTSLLMEELQYYYPSSVIEYKRMLPDTDPGQVIFNNPDNILNAPDGSEVEILNSADHSGGYYAINHACMVVAFNGAVHLENGAIQALARNLWGGPDTMNLAIEASSQNLRCDDGPWDFSVRAAPATAATWYGGSYTGVVRTVRVRVWSNANVLHRPRKMYIDAIRLYGTFTPDPTPTPIYTPTNTLTPTATNTPSFPFCPLSGGMPAQTIALAPTCQEDDLLSSYRVKIVHPNPSNPNDPNSEWTADQLARLYAAVTKTAEALKIFTNQVDPSDTSTPEQIFVRVMIGSPSNVIEVVVQNSATNCITNKPNPEPGITARITCYANATEL